MILPVHPSQKAFKTHVGKDEGKKWSEMHSQRCKADEAADWSGHRRGTLKFFGAMVQRLARGPFKAEIRVRFPLALPMS